MSLNFKFPEETDLKPFSNGDYWSEEVTSLVHNMWFCGTGHFKKQEDKDLFWKRYLLLNLSMGHTDVYLTKAFLDSVPLGLWTNGGTLTDAAFNKKLVINMNDWVTRKIDNDKREAANRG